jgi:hypothetical protein
MGYSARCFARLHYVFSSFWGRLEWWRLFLFPSNFAIITDKNEEQNQKTIIILLNDAWKYFWDKPDEFRHWEEKSIGELKRYYLGI